MHMQAKGTTDYKSGFTFAFEQLLNVRANTLFREGQCKGECLSATEGSPLTCWSYVTIPPACYYTSCQLDCLTRLIKVNQQ